MKKDLPNILWYCTDQQRYDTIGALNNPHVITPNIDRLVHRGTAFTKNYCQSPICTPSRASFPYGLLSKRDKSPAKWQFYLFRSIPTDIKNSQ